MLHIVNAAGRQAASSVRGEEQPSMNTKGLATAPLEQSKQPPEFAGELSELTKLDDELIQLNEDLAKLETQSSEKIEPSEIASPLGAYSAAPNDMPRDPRIQPKTGHLEMTAKAEQPKMTVLEAAEQILRSASVYFTNANANANVVASNSEQHKGSEEVALANLAVVRDMGPTGKDSGVTGKDLGAVFNRSDLSLAMQAGGIGSNASGSDSSNQSSNARSAMPAGDMFAGELENMKGLVGANTPSLTGSISGSGPAPLAGQTLHAPVLEQSLKLQGPEAKWGEQMLNSLRDNVELQVQQRMQSATIRLDPPELGSMEILLKHEAGHLTVQISAAQVDVARLLQQVSERLRQELIEQNFTQVSVEVSSDGESDQQQSRHRRGQLPSDEPVIAGQQGQALQNEKAARPSDVLITV